VIEEEEVLGIGREVLAIDVDCYDEGPEKCRPEGQGANSQVECLASICSREVRELKETAPDHSQKLVPPDLIQVGDGSCIDASKKSSHPVGRVLAAAVSDNGSEEDPKNEDSIYDENRVERAKEEDIDVELLENVVGHQQGPPLVEIPEQI